MSRLRLIILVCSIVYSQHCFSQSSNAEDGEQTVFANVNLGVGSIYGGIGLNSEVGYKHMSVFGSFGYAPERLVEEITIKSSWNYHTGVRYYFDINQEAVFPRAGLGFGWITNYYNTKIGSASYNQNVYGFSAHAGTQIYSHVGVVFSIDLVVTAQPFILNSDQHPHFQNLYLRPTIGIGYDLQRLFKKRTKNVQNKTIDPFG
jgi:hypothetical protein